jgi:hypothetical protein
MEEPVGESAELMTVAVLVVVVAFERVALVLGLGKSMGKCNKI